MLAWLDDRPLITGIGLLAAGFALQACGGEGPREVAERFWDAAQARDIETVEALSIPAEGTSFDFDEDDTDIGELTIGEAAIDGDRAEVETLLAMENDEMALDVEFQTVLRERDGRWLVDMEETTGEIMSAVIGASMQQIGEAIGEGMKEAMQGMAEGLREGMEEMAESFDEAKQDRRDRKEGDSR